MQRAIDDDLVAPPPDDGGHQGNFTRPEDEVMVSPHDGHPTPPMHYDATWTNTIARDEHPHRGLGRATGTLVIAAICAALVALAVLLAGG